jgi:aspartyl-tRNA(Asn)/glutamyl-tRNA(Gln) amidotransferase subunit A
MQDAATRLRSTLPPHGGGDVAALPWALGVAEAARAIAAGALSPVDLLESCLDRIAALDGTLSCFIRVMATEARAEAATAAAEIAAGRLRGPLHGIPFAVKDNYDVAGVPATAASRLRLDRVPGRDAALVAALRAAGAVLVGKLATWEYGTGNGAEYFDLPFPPARNPWDASRATGGSSTGAGAAVAAGMLPFALGSDTTGSVRLPAGATGVLGMIATQGRLSTAGILPNCHSLDVPGIFCRNAADAALVMGTLTGDAITLPEGATGMRVGVIRDPGPGMPAPDAAMAAAFEAGLQVLAGLGVVLEEAALPVPAAECLAVTQMIGPAESAAIHEAELREDAGRLGRALRDKLLAGSTVRAVDYIQAQRRRTEIAAGIDALAARFDALVTFGNLHLPPRLGVEPEMTGYTLDTLFTPFNLSAHPALVQRTGFSADGLPTHWQIVAPRGREDSALRLAAAFESATGWARRWPEVAAEAPPPPPVAPPDATAPSGALRARAAAMGLAGLADADLARMEVLEARMLERGLALPRPAAKQTPPAFGMARPPD